MKATQAFRAFIEPFRASESPETGFDDSARNFGGKAAEIVALVFAIAAISFVVFDITLGLVRSAGHGG